MEHNVDSFISTEACKRVIAQLRAAADKKVNLYNRLNDGQDYSSLGFCRQQAKAGHGTQYGDVHPSYA